MSGSHGSAAGVDARFDLTRMYSKFLDPHFLIPVFSFMKNKGIYSSSAMDALLAKVLKNTKYTPEKAAETFPGVPTAGLTSEAAVAKERSELYSICGPDVVAAVEGGAEATPDLRGSSEGVFKLSKFLYETGNYAGASSLLQETRKQNPGVPPAEALASLWGKFAADIMAGNWDEANACRSDVAMAIDRSSSPKHVTQQQRSWALHWSLFVFFCRSGGMDALLENFLVDANRQVIQFLCPWLTRYIAAAVVLTRRRYVLHGLLTLLREVQYRDPIVEFVELLVVRYDFDAAQAKLKECEAVLKTDYFLGSHVEVADFMEAAKLQMFQLYCRLHTTVDLDFVAKMLDKDAVAAEAWVVELIRAGTLKARINSADRQVIVEPPQSRIHQVVAEKTRSTLSRATFVWNRLGFAPGFGGGSKFK